VQLCARGDLPADGSPVARRALRWVGCGDRRRCVCCATIPALPCAHAQRSNAQRATSFLVVNYVGRVLLPRDAVGSAVIWLRRRGQNQGLITVRWRFGTGRRLVRAHASGSALRCAARPAAVLRIGPGRTRRAVPSCHVFVVSLRSQWAMRAVDVDCGRRRHAAPHGAPDHGQAPFAHRPV
jgi:hypothetical protein